MGTYCFGLKHSQPLTMGTDVVSVASIFVD